MGTAVVYDTFTTGSGLQGVKYALGQALRQVGGAMSETGDGLWVANGVQNVSMGFTAQLTAQVSVRQTAPDRYEVACALNWKPSAVTWICFVAGFFFLWFLWIPAGLYFIFNPASAYQFALSQAHAYLPDAPAQPAYATPAYAQPGAYQQAYVQPAPAVYAPPAPPVAPVPPAPVAPAPEPAPAPTEPPAPPAV